MKKLIYKGEEIDTLSEQEARELTNAKGLTIIFKGQRLRASQLEVMNEKSYSKERHITEYSTPELKQIISDFEIEYKKHNTGEMIFNSILGSIREGIVSWAISIRAITENKIKGKDVYFVNLPNYDLFRKQFSAMNELIYRREFAKKVEAESLETLVEN